MSCLGDRLTALVDGELDHDGRDRALSHLAGCADCRAEAEALRGLKRRLSSLREVPADVALLARLYGMDPQGARAAAPPEWGAVRPQAGPVGPEPSDELIRSLYRLDDHGQGEELSARYRRPRDTRPARGHGHQQPVHRRRLPRARYLVAGAATLAALGAGSAPYVGAGTTARVPKVSPSWSHVSVHNGISQVRLPRRPDEKKR